MPENLKLSLKHRLNIHGWLIMLSGAIATVIALRFWQFLPEPASKTTLLYLSIATPSQMMLLALLIGLLTSPLILLPWHGLRHLSYAIVVTAGLSLLAIDTIVFSQYRFHINEVVMKLVMSGEVVSFSLQTWLIIASAAIALASLIYGLTRWLHDHPEHMRSAKGRWVAYLIFLALLLTHGIHIWAAAYGVQPIIQTARYLPLFQPATANRFMEKRGWIDREALRRQQGLKFKASTELNYPLTTLKSDTVEQPTDVLMIVIDSWRHDSFGPETTPALWDLSRSGTVFENHYSTGNSTRAGIFGLFYGLPAPYWASFLSNRQGPILIKRLIELQYEVGIFASAQLTQPEFDQTVFADISKLRLNSDGNTPAERDRDITTDWLDWFLHERTLNKPSFSFLFYDAPHGYDFPTDYPHHFKPMLDNVNYLSLSRDSNPEPFINRYKNAVHYTDSLIAEVIKTLKDRGSLENTLIIVTGDHGQEFNDNGLNFWGHNSNYTDPQVKVPLFLRGPSVPRKDLWSSEGTFTSHEDIAPTLLINYLGISNSAEEFATGVDLYDEVQHRPWRMAGKYSGYALIDDSSILEVTSLGRYLLMNRRNQPLPGQEVDIRSLRQALERLRKFSH